MHHTALYKLLATVLLTQAVLSSQAQSPPANQPGAITQVPAPTGTVAPTPSGYIVNGQAPLLNFVRERDAMSRITDTGTYSTAAYSDVKEATQYFDGLGRPLQTVTRQITPGTTPSDIVAPVLYDAFGREVYKYLPYVPTTANVGDGSFKMDPFADQKNFYQNTYPAEQPGYKGEQVYYGQTNYEASPLNRVTQSLAQGNSWAGSGNGISTQYQSNTDADYVVMWDINSSALPVFIRYYPAGELYKTITVDEQGHAVLEFKDKEGQIIFKKVQVWQVPADYTNYYGWLNTYYVYDRQNQLRFVMPPKATGLIGGNGWDPSVDPTIVDELCYRYEYDARKRIIAKKIPGAGWTYMVYDRRDRLVYTQDANMRSRNQWMTTLYDGLNRPVTTGMITYTGTRDQLQQYVTDNTGNGTPSSITVNGATPTSIPRNLSLNNMQNTGAQSWQASDEVNLDSGFDIPDDVDFTAEVVPGGTTTAPFTNAVAVVDNPLPTASNFIALTMTFYDDYSNTPDKQYTPVYNNLLDDGGNLHAEDLPSITDLKKVQTIGMITGIKVRVIEDPSDLTKGTWLSAAGFYDDRSQVIQTQSDNYKGGRDTLVNRYNFTGQVISSYLTHTDPVATSNGNTHIKTNLNYDHANRLLQVYKTINDADSTKRLIVQHIYDKMGQLKQKQLGQLPGGGFLETQDYTYNIRGWLKGINKDYANNDNSTGGNSRWFGMELGYDWGFATNQLNGNISGTKWRSKGDGQQRAYGFGYDAANRLMYSDFNQYSGSEWDKSAGIDFSTVMGDGSQPYSAYDENGNILAMSQKGWQLGGSNTIDALSYTYYNNSNKLKNVIDGSNNPKTTLGDFRTSSLSPYATSKTNAAVDYVYDDNGNMKRDLNKDIGSQSTDGIIYNHLNLPWKVTVRSANGTKGTITYTYDAAGNKLKKATADDSTNILTVITYIGGFQYQGQAALSDGAPADTLKFFGQEEGRVRVNVDTTGGQSLTSFKYDYFIKDHLGNTRAVLTDEQQMDKYPAATMELASRATENLLYSQLDNTQFALPAGYPTDTTTKPNQYVAHVGGFTGPKIGPGITLKVMAGDQVSIKVSSWYKTNGTQLGAPGSPLSDLVTALISGVSGLPRGSHPSVQILQSNSAPLSDNLNLFLQDNRGSLPNAKPQAFVNWVLFDNQFNYVSSSSGFDQVGNDQEFKRHILPNLPMSKSGYLYIYTSNETPNIDVFFDNLQVTHTRGPLLEETHYYPFGLQMAGISDKAIKTNYVENKFKFNDGSELANKEFSDGSGLEFYETGYRSYDPQLGKFHQIDPIGEATEDWSPYAYALDNPVYFNDPLGLSPNDSTGHDSGVKPMQEVVVTAKKKGCTTCNAPDPSKNVGPAPAGVHALPINGLKPVPPSGKVIPLSEPIPLLAIGLKIWWTIGAVLTPLSTGQEGIPQPNPLFSPRRPDSKRDNDGTIILYRGVDATSPAFKFALEGIAMPWDPDNGHKDPALHNKGGGINTKSIFTSWTTRPSVAASFAGRYGVVLVKRFQIGQLMPSPDIHNEQEILVPGIVTGASVFSSWTTKRL